MVRETTLILSTRMFVVVLLAVSVAVNCDSTDNEDVYTKETSLLDNVCTSSHSINLPDGMIAKTIPSCARLCSEQNECFGFFYQSKDDHCVLCNHSFVPTDPTSLTVMTGSMYYQRSECNGWARGFGNKNLRIYQNAVDRDTAQSICELNNGQLVKIDDAASMIQLSNVLTSCPSYQYSGNSYWTDGEYDGDTGIYRFSDGTAVPMDSPEYWEETAPDNNDECFRLRFIPQSNMYRWNDMACQREFRFICEFQSYILYRKGRG